MSKMINVPLDDLAKLLYAYSRSSMTVMESIKHNDPFSRLLIIVTEEIGREEENKGADGDTVSGSSDSDQVSE